MFDVRMYKKSNGEIPVREHIDSLSQKMQIKVFANIERLRIKGNLLREPYTKFLEDGVFELRTSQGGSTERILFFFIEGEKIILTHGFLKKTRKIPSSEIQKAKNYRDDYLR